MIHGFGIGGIVTLHLAAALGFDSVDSSGWRQRAPGVPIAGRGPRLCGAPASRRAQRVGPVRRDSPERRIVTYDQILSDREPPGRYARALRRAVAGPDYDFVHVNLGRAYLRAMGEVCGLFPGAELTFATGGIGRRSAQTTAWVAARRLSAG